MNIKLKDTNKEVKVEDFKFRNQKKLINDMISNKQTLEKYILFINKEAKNEWKKNKEKLDKRVKHLEKKHKSKATLKTLSEALKSRTRPLDQKQKLQNLPSMILTNKTSKKMSKKLLNYIQSLLLQNLST